jgi:PTS system nitrogen regulatory IIA component
MKLSSFLLREFVFLNRDFSTFPEVLSFISAQMAQRANLPVNIVQDAFDKRVQLGSVYLGNGFAYPHARLESFDDAILFFVRTAHPIEVPGHEVGSMIPANGFFAMLAGTTDVELYLSMVRAMAVMIQGQSEALLGAQSADDVLAILDKGIVDTARRLSAKELMEPCGSVNTGDSVAVAFDMMKRYGVGQLAVIDKHSKVVGWLRFNDLLKSCFPQYLQHLPNISFSTTFDPIQNVWQNEQQISVDKSMRPCHECVAQLDESYPEIILRVLRQDLPCVFVVDKNNVLQGCITLDSIIGKLLRP